MEFMERQLMHELIQWKNNPLRKPLMFSRRTLVTLVVS